MSSSGGEFYLGVDLGTTYAAAGILRRGRPEVVTLGDRSAVVPSVLYFREDGDVLVGEPANRRGLMDPSRVVREFKRRVGDSTPMVVGSTPYSAEALLARLLWFIHDEVVTRQGAAPAGVTVTHPANWGAYKVDVLQQAVRMADVGEVETLTEPVAAAVHYAATERLENGQAVAVYDLGGGTFDAAVVRRGGSGFELLGDVEGIERLGGIDLDEAVFQHVVRWCDSAFGELDADDPAVLQAVARVRQECVAAKEALSADTDVAIPVVLPNVQTEVRLTRAEFEAMIRPLLQQTVEALRRAVRSASVDVNDLAAVLLVGGSSQIPLVAEMVGAELGRPIAVDQHPKHTVALGAAIAAGQGAGAVSTVASPSASVAPASTVATTARTEFAAPSRSASPNVVSAAVGSGGGGPLDSLLEETTVMPSQSSPLQSSPSQSSIRASSSSPIMPAPVMPSPVVSQVAPPSPPIVDRSPRYSNDAANRGGTGGGRSAVLIGAMVLAVMAVVGGVFWVAGRGGDTGDVPGPDDVAADPAAVVVSSTTEATTSTPPTSSTTGASSTTVASPTTSSSSTSTTLAGLTATITDVAIDGGRYAVSYSTNFTPLISSDPSATHLHFFFDTVPIEQAGVPGGGPWILYDGPMPFTGYGPGDRPAGANQMCVTAANHAHEVVDTGLYHCMDLPEG